MQFCDIFDMENTTAQLYFLYYEICHCKSLLSGVMTDRYHKDRKQMTLYMIYESISFFDMMKDETVSQNCSNPPFSSLTVGP